VTESCHVTSNSGITIGPAELHENDIIMSPRLRMTVSPEAIPVGGVLDGSHAAGVEVTLVDEEGLPQPNAMIVVEASYGSFDYPSQLSEITLLTDGDGKGVYDLNGDGIIDPGEPKIINLYSPVEDVAASVTATAIAVPSACIAVAPVLFFKDSCGPDVTAGVAAALQQIGDTFNGWDHDYKALKCLSLIDFPTGLWAWDMEEMWKWHEYYPSGVVNGAEIYASCSTGDCFDSVQIDGGCHIPWDINYVTWGKMCRLCYDWLKMDGEPADSWNRDEMSTRLMFYYLFKHPFKSPDDALAWGQAGWDGWPNATSPAPSMPLCALKCGKTFYYPNTGPLLWHWGGYQPRQP